MRIVGSWLVPSCRFFQRKYSDTATCNKARLWIQEKTATEYENKGRRQDPSDESRKSRTPGLRAQKLNRTTNQQTVQDVIVWSWIGRDDALVGLRGEWLQGVRFIVSEASAQCP